MPVITSASKVILTGETHGLEPIRRSNFSVVIVNTKGDFAPDDCDYMLKSFDPPELGVDVRSVRFGNHDRTYPDKRTCIQGSPLIIRCLTRKGAASKAHQFFKEWFDQVYDTETDSVGLMGDDNKGRVTLIPVSVGPGSVFGSVSLEGAWPSAIKLDSMDMDDDGECLNFTVTFQCRHVDYQF